MSVSIISNYFELFIDAVCTGLYGIVIGLSLRDKQQYCVLLSSTMLTYHLYNIFRPAYYNYLIYLQWCSDELNRHNNRHNRQNI